MAESGNSKAKVEGGTDRISNLPRNVIDRILEFVPTRDIVRTSILSTKWRYVWVGHQKLVMDKQFVLEVLKNTSTCPYVRIVSVINRILLQHIGPILIFDIDSSLVTGEEIDLWLLVLSWKGVRELTLDNSPVEGCVSDHYELSSHLFSCCELTHLSISNCILKVPSKFRGFSKLNKLILQDIILGSFLLMTPLLVHLELRCCSGVRNFNVVAPILEVLLLKDNDDVELTHYMICQKLKMVDLDHYDVKSQRQGQRIINLIELFSCWPRLSELSIDGISLKNLCAGTVSGKLPMTLDHFRCLKLHNVSFDSDQFAWVLCIIRSSPILHKFQILGYSFPSSAGEVMKLSEYFKEPVFKDQNIEQLSIVELKDFKGSKAELLLVGLLLNRSPSLEKLLVHEDSRLSVNQRLAIMKMLLMFPRASAKAKIILGNV